MSRYSVNTSPITLVSRTRVFLNTWEVTEKTALGTHTYQCRREWTLVMWSDGSWSLDDKRWFNGVCVNNASWGKTDTTRMLNSIGCGI